MAHSADHGTRHFSIRRPGKEVVQSGRLSAEGVRWSGIKLPFCLAQRANGSHIRADVCANVYKRTRAHVCLKFSWHLRWSGSELHVQHGYEAISWFTVYGTDSSRGGDLRRYAAGMQGQTTGRTSTEELNYHHSIISLPCHA